MRGKSRWPYFATRTSVSKSTSVMSFASLSVLRNLTAADRDSLMSSPMLPLVSNSRPTCSSGPVSTSVAAREVLERLLLAVLDDLEVVGGEIGEVLALLVDDGDAEGREVDPGAERRRLRGRSDVTPTAMIALSTGKASRRASASNLPRSYTRSETLVHRDSAGLRAAPAI